MIKRNVYKWHRICSLIVAIPVLLWALSGFMHPVMTSLRPAIALQSLPVSTIDSSKIKLTLGQVLKQNKIDSIYSVRMVHIDTNWFYQIGMSRKYNLWYISAKNGNVLPRGDWLYAQYLARLFLEGVPKTHKNKMSGMDMSMPMSSSMDCCGEAASAVLNNKTGAGIENAALITKFDAEYKSIYCLLPVYKVQFKRSDDIRLYVETGSDRLGIAVDKNRALFTTFFDIVHTWGWLNFLGKGRLLVVMLIAGLGFFTSLMGLYIFFSTKSKKLPGNTVVKARRNHRYTAVVASIFTLMFTFSGCYQALSEFTSQEKQVVSAQDSFAATAVPLNINRLQNIVQKPVTNIGLVKMNDQVYWQVYQQNSLLLNNHADLMKDLSAAPALVTYVNAKNYSVFKEGDELYAKALATKFSRHTINEIKSAELITHFTDEYNFTDKRLPVWKINYPFNQHERYYIETATGVLAKQTNDAHLYEGYSFALLHKHHYMDFAGKTGRDVSTMIAATLQVIMVVIGLIFYFKWRKRKVKVS